MVVNEPLSIIIVLLAAVAGLPHGAMDYFVAKRMGLWCSPTQLLFWLLKYIAIAALVVFVWWLVPALALSIFLLLSALHFGRDFFPQRWFLALASGVFILALPAYFHDTLVTTYFELLWLPTSQAELVVYAMKWALGGVLLSSFVGFIVNVKLNLALDKVCQLCLLLVLAWLFNPLIYFALYFALSHSPKHLLSQWRKLPEQAQGSALFTLGLLTAIPVIAGAFVVWVSGRPILDSLVGVIFIGLAALTFPHMLLIERELRESQYGR